MRAIQFAIHPWFIFYEIIDEVWFLVGVLMKVSKDVKKRDQNTSQSKETTEG